MSVATLEKGAVISLGKVRKIHIGAGWEPRKTDGEAFDLDLTLFLLGEDNKVKSTNEMIYYRNQAYLGDVVVHSGDNEDGEGEGDDEFTKLDLDRLPVHITKVCVAVSIHYGNKRNQNFGQVDDAFVRVADDESGTELARFELTDGASTDTAFIFADLIRKDDGWRFRNVSKGFRGGLKALCNAFGLTTINH